MGCRCVFSFSFSLPRFFVYLYLLAADSPLPLALSLGGKRMCLYVLYVCVVCLVPSCGRLVLEYRMKSAGGASRGRIYPTERKNSDIFLSRFVAFRLSYLALPG